MIILTLRFWKAVPSARILANSAKVSSPLLSVATRWRSSKLTQVVQIGGRSHAVGIPVAAEDEGGAVGHTAIIVSEASLLQFLEAVGFLAYSQALQANGAKLRSTILRLLSIQLGAHFVGRMLNLRLDRLIFFAFADCFLANAAYWHGHTHFLELVD